jgi:hypothetical protein
MGKAAVDSPPVSSAGGDHCACCCCQSERRRSRALHACIRSLWLPLRRISQIRVPDPMASLFFFYRTTTSATPSTRILHRIRHSVLLGPVLRARREESACVLFIFASTKKKKAEKGKARRIPRPVVFASPISRPEHTRQRITARTLMSFFAVCTHSAAQALIYLNVPQNVQILQHTCLSRCTRTARTSLNILRILPHACLRW